MKKLIFLTVFLFLASFLPSLAFAQSPSGPKMVIEGRDFDFKEVQEGKVAEHVFKVLNKGNQPLEIHKVNPG